MQHKKRMRSFLRSFEARMLAGLLALLFVVKIALPTLLQWDMTQQDDTGANMPVLVICTSTGFQYTDEKQQDGGGAPTVKVDCALCHHVMDMAILMPDMGGTLWRSLPRLKVAIAQSESRYQLALTAYRGRAPPSATLS